MPFSKLGTPNVNRLTPVCRSVPTVDSIRPTPADAAALAGEPPTSVKEKSSAPAMTPKYSAGPNFSANSASGGARSIRPMTESVPPIHEPIAAMASAEPARPCLAISCPSIAVITDDASPGTLRSTEVSDPPYMAPQYTAVIMMSAESGDIRNATGMSSATVVEGPMPGSTPRPCQERRRQRRYQVGK